MAGRRCVVVLVATIVMLATPGAAAAAPGRSRPVLRPTQDQPAEPVVTVTDLPGVGWWGDRYRWAGEQISNDGRTVLGNSYELDGDPGYPVMWRDGVAVSLLPEDQFGRTGDRSERGQIVGTWGGRPDEGAFLWEGGQVTRLSTAGTGVAVNEAGQVLLGTPAGPAVWRDGHTTAAPVLGWGLRYFPGGDINDQGEVMLNYGYSIPSPWSVVPRDVKRPAIWRPGRGLTNVGPWDGQANALNARGQVAGTMHPPGGGTRAFLWDGRRTIDLGTLAGADHSEATALNDLGHVVGNSSTSGGSDARAFLWRDGQMIDLGTLAGGRTWATDVNNSDEVVGFSEVAGERHAFLWRDGQMIDLGAAVPGNFVDTMPVDINDRGQVVGYTDNWGTIRGVMWSVSP